VYDCGVSFVYIQSSSSPNREKKRSSSSASCNQFLYPSPSKWEKFQDFSFPIVKQKKLTIVTIFSRCFFFGIFSKLHLLHSTFVEMTDEIKTGTRYRKNILCWDIVNSRHFLTVSWGDQLKGTSKADVGNLQSHEHLTCDRIGSYLFFFLLLHYWNLFGNNLPLSVQKIRGQVCLGDILLNNKPTCVMCT
jgi:hypothetical protein